MLKRYICEEAELEDFCTDLFSAYGFAPDDARAISRQLISADMRGMPSHGVVRVEMYLTHVRKGAIDPRAKPEIVRDTPTTAVIEGHKAAGAVTSELASALARRKAEAYGLGMVAARNSNHHGTCAYWGLKMARQDMIAFVASNTPPFLAAPASRQAVIGNNPISVVVPGGKTHMCLDISNGVMAYGKIHDYRRQNRPFPENAWLDEHGNPTTDPFANDFLKFISLPVGLHKGFGLAVMAEAVTSMLSGGLVADQIAPPGADLEADNPTSHCFVAVDIGRFRDVAQYRQEVDRFIDYLHSLPARNSGEHILYPGEPEEMALEKSLREGISVPGDVRDFLCQKAEEAGVAVPAPLVAAPVDE